MGTLSPEVSGVFHLVLGYHVFDEGPFRAPEQGLEPLELEDVLLVGGHAVDQTYFLEDLVGEELE